MSLEQKTRYLDHRCSPGGLWASKTSASGFSGVHVVAMNIFLSYSEVNGVIVDFFKQLKTKFIVNSIENTYNYNFCSHKFVVVCLK